MAKLKTRLIMEDGLKKELEEDINIAKESNNTTLVERLEMVLNDIPKMSDAMLIFWIGRFIENK